MTLKNCGGVSAGFKFVLPSDNALEIEGWADTGEKTPEEEFEEHIINEKIFEIHPR